MTLLEIIVTVAILALTASLVMPILTSDTMTRLQAASAVLRSDIELAQVMTAANPTDPIRVVFGANQTTYALLPASARTTPISRLDGSPYEEEMGIGRLSSCENVVISLYDVPSNELEFNAYGGLKDFTIEPEITLTLGNETLTIHIAATTGTMHETIGVVTTPNN